MGDRQSEHLNDAQIESYGTQASGIGAESADAVERHLADCPSCRGRVLEFQRAHLALLADPTVNTGPTSACPSENDLRELAAGLCTDNRAAELNLHVAQCDHCGPLLRVYREDFSDEFSEEEKAELSQLESASSEWQKKMARLMLAAANAGPASFPSTTAPATASGREKGDDVSLAKNESRKVTASSQKPAVPERRRSFSWRWFPIPVATACAVIIFAVLFALRETPEKARTQLAKSYTENRQIEIRWPGAAYGNLVQKRGPNESSLGSSPNLIRTGEQITRHLQKEPDNPDWLLLSAQYELLGWHYGPALSSLEKINDPRIQETPEFLMTRALALYEKSEVDKKDPQYFEAMNLLSEALQKRPGDPVLLFNHALACEKSLQRACAVEDWNHFLQIEHDPNWIAEARDHLDRINEKKNLTP